MSGTQEAMGGHTKQTKRCYFRKRGSYRYIPLLSGSFKGTVSDRAGRVASYVIWSITAAALVTGLAVFKSNDLPLIPVVKWPLFFAVMLGGLIFHEILRVAYARLDGYTKYEAGIRLWRLVSTGTYVRPSRRSISGGLRWRVEARHWLVGACGSLMVSGVVYLLAVLINDPFSTFTLIVTARLQLVLAAVNLLPVQDSKGATVLYDVLDAEEGGKKRAATYKVVVIISQVLLLAILTGACVHIFKLAVDSAWPPGYVLDMYDFF